MGPILNAMQVKGLFELRQFEGRRYTAAMQDLIGWDIIAIAAGGAALALWYRTRRGSRAASGSPRRTLVPLLVAILLAGIAFGLAWRGGG